VRVLYFGTYERDYPRNTQVIAALRTAGIDVAERHVPVWEDRRHKLAATPAVAARLARAELQLLSRPKVEFDVVIVGYPGHFDMLAARRIAGHRPLVFNPLVALEDTLVGDRALVGANSLRARALRLVDRRAFRRADLVVADTATHAQFFAERFGLEPGRLAYCFVGAQDDLFTPAESRPVSFTALFVGKLIPLHGLDTILEAAALLPEIAFRFVGSGQLEEQMTGRPDNVSWEPWVEYQRLPDVYRSASCALGIFGTSDKAGRVIPNKAFQALATATPLITADTEASRELLTHEHDALLVPPGNATALAAAIDRMAGDDGLRLRLASNGRSTYVEHASEAVLGARWRAILEGLMR
jgi:glycosyltransferase involved in cell wall biosynthesis